jgi:hypothetical protein
MCDWALRYASLGMAVMPLHSVDQFGACSCRIAQCKPVGKHPRTRHGVSDASTDEAIIRSWWSRWPDANIGVATGSKSGIIVLDVDPRNGGDRTLDERVMQHGALPETVHVRTGGGGSHYYFRRAAHASTYHDPAGIDVLGDGGYVVAPPSATASPYEFHDCSSPFDDGVYPNDAPAWVTALVERVSAPEPGKGKKPAGPLVPMQPFELRCVRQALDVLAQTDAPVARDSWIRVGMALHSTETVEAFALWDSWSQTSPDKYNRGECVKQWRSFSATANGIRLGSMFDMAKHHGWSFPVETVALVEATPAKDGADYPQELLRIPGALQAFVDYANGNSKRAQPKLTIAAAVSLGATVMARRYSWRGSRSSLFQLIVAETGMGKDAGRKAIKNVMRASERMSGRLLGEEFKSGAAVMSTVAGCPAGIALIDEYGLYLRGINDKNAGQHAREIAPKLMKMYSSTDTIMLGDEYGDKKVNGRKDIEHPCTNVYGTSTMSSLANGITADQIEDGFLNRHLVILGDENPPWVDLDEVPGIPVKLIAWMNAADTWIPPNGGDLIGLPGNPIVLGEEAGVRKMMLAFRDFADQRVIETNEIRAGVGGVWCRAYENASRLCVALAGSECSFLSGDAPRVSCEAVRWAIAYVTWSTQMIVNLAVGELAENLHGKAVNNAIKAVRKAGARGMTPNELRMGIRQMKENPQIRANVLGDLGMYGVAGPVDITPAAQHGGKRRIVYIDSKFIAATDGE